MEKILDTFFGLKLINRLDGDDQRYLKIEKAAENLAKIYQENPSKLIPAIISGLNSQVNVLEPSIIQAKECLREEWKSFETVYSDESVNLYRGIILEACSQVAEEGNNAAIMWLTASDVLPLLDFGKEKEVLQQFMFSLAHLAESKSIREIQDVAFQKTKTINLGEISEAEALGISRTNQAQLLDGIGRAVWSTYVDINGQTVNNNETKNRYGVNNGPHWAGDVAKIMSSVLASEFDRVARAASSNENKCLEYVSTSQATLQRAIEKALNEQRLSLQKQHKEFIGYQKEEQTRLNVLWWSEALYSPTINNSYRSCEKELAAVLMAYDLLDTVKIPTPASVGYMLSETLSKLPGITFETSCKFLGFLTKLSEQKGGFPQLLLESATAVPENQVLNIRDLVIKVLANFGSNNFDDLIAKSVMPKDWECSLPMLSRAIFKQEQAYRLAGVGGQDE